MNAVGTLVWRRLPLAMLLVLVVCCCGCVEKSNSGNATHYYNAFWATAVCLIGGLAAAVVGWFVRPSSDRFGWGLMIIGVLVVLGVTPTIFFENTVVREDGFFVRSGLWGMSSYDVKFDNTSNITLTREETRGRRGRKNINHYLVCSQKAGEEQKVPLGGCCEEAAEDILVAATARGIPIINATGE